MQAKNAHSVNVDFSESRLGGAGCCHRRCHAPRHVGERRIYTLALQTNVSSGEEHTRGYTLLDATVNYDLRKLGRLTLGVENLTNKFYILSWSQVVGFRNYWAGRGRVVSLTHTLTF